LRNHGCSSHLDSVRLPNWNSGSSNRITLPSGTFLAKRRYLYIMSLPRLALIGFVLVSLLPAFGQQGAPLPPPQAQSPEVQQPVSPATPDAPETNATPPVGSQPRTSPKATTDGNPPKAAERTAPALDLVPDANGALSQAQMQQLFRVVADKDIANDNLQRDYTYIKREVESKLDGKGQTKSTETKTYEVLQIYGEQVERVIEKGDKPLSPKDAAKEESRIQKIVEKRKNESESDRKKREEREIKDRKQGRKFVTEVADAYNFKLVGSEQVGGRDTWVIDGEPRPGFVPHMKESRLLTKFHGRVWIDKADLQLARMDVECLDTISFGLFLARFHKGSRLMLEQTRVNDEVWLPSHVAAKIDVRLALVKGFNVGVEQTFRDYKKFRSSSKIVGVAEVQDERK